MARLYFFLLIFFLFPARFATALDSDRNQPAAFKAQDIEIDFNTGQRTYRGNVTIQQGTLRMKADVIHLFLMTTFCSGPSPAANQLLFNNNPKEVITSFEARHKPSKLTKSRMLRPFPAKPNCSSTTTKSRGKPSSFTWEPNKYNASPTVK